MRRIVLAAVATLVATIGLALPAGAVTSGSPDGNNHPYVGYADNGSAACSGTILSPTVFLTAAHCFSSEASLLGNNSSTGAPLIRVSFDPDLANQSAAQRTFYVGSYYFDPEFAIGGGGKKHFDTHDVAIVIFGEPGCSTPPSVETTYVCGPMASAVTLGRYGKLPSLGLDDTLRQSAVVDVVGYGIQNFANGGGPCEPNCKKTGADSATRFYAPTTLLATGDVTAEEFIKLHSNKGGICFGDSGGPDLLGGTNTVLAVNSFLTNSVCSGDTYSYRVDTRQAQTWIAQTAAAHGAGF